MFSPCRERAPEDGINNWLPVQENISAICFSKYTESVLAMLSRPP